MRREGNELVVTLGSDYAKTYREERRVDQIVVEHGTTALDELYHALKGDSVNFGEVDYPALLQDGAIFPQRNPEGRYRLYRIGDAVASRNIHAGIYDALRFGIRW